MCISLDIIFSYWFGEFDYMLKRFVALQVIAGLLVSKITSLAIYPMKYRS